MLKHILIALLLSLSTAYAQFVVTNPSYIQGNKNEIVNYNNHQGNDRIDNGVTFTMKWEGKPTNIRIELIHDADAFIVYPSDLDNGFSVPNIHSFDNGRWSGKWQIKINSDSPFTVTEWSVVPEPSSVGIAVGLSLIGFVFLRKKF